jgi:hypothetical protein
MDHDENKLEERPAATIEELESDWWEALSCKCDIDFEEE